MHDTIESLQAESAQLRAALASLRRTAAERADLLESLEVVTQGEDATAREMTRLAAQFRTVEATAGQWRTTVGELQRERHMLRRRLGQ